MNLIIINKENDKYNDNNWFSTSNIAYLCSYPYSYVEICYSPAFRSSQSL